LRPEGTITATTTVIVIKTANLITLLQNLRLFTLEIIYTHIPWIHQCVIKTKVCGTRLLHKYAELQCKIVQTFHKNGIINSSGH
jgi:hypothetical protein